MSSILFIDGGGWNGITTVQVNVINYFLDQGHAIEIIIFDNGIKPDPIKYKRWPIHNKIAYHVINQKTFLDKICNRIFIFRHFLKFIKCRRFLNRFDRYYAFDYEGGLICGFQKFFRPSVKFFIHSIELYKNTESSFFVRKAFSKATFTIIQDWVRKERLVELYSLSPEKVLISINSSRNSDLTDVTPIDFPDHIKDKKKLLFIGSLIEEHCFPDVLNILEAIPKDLCLIIHGWGGDKYRDQLNQLIKARPDNIWLSNLELNDITKFRLYASVDIGFVTFNKAFYNCEFAGLSAGKLFDLIRVGKPVIASDIMGLSQFVLEHQIGKVITDFNDVFVLASEIMANYGKFSVNTIEVFHQYEFDENFQHVYNQFISLT